MSSLADIYALPEGKRAELIDGVLYMLAAPADIHQNIVLQLGTFLNAYVKQHKCDCIVRIAPSAVFLNKDDKTYLEPDIYIVCDKNKMKEDGCHGAPDLIIEVLSPGNKERDKTKKLIKYYTAGVKEYWMIDPYRKLIDIRMFDSESSDYYSFDEEVPVGIFNNEAAIVLNKLL